MACESHSSSLRRKRWHVDLADSFPASEESSSVGDIPSGSKHEAKADANAAAEDPVEDEDEDDGEESVPITVHLTHHR